MRGGGLPVRVKICGLRRLEDALLAARLGADAIGVLVSHCSSAAELEPRIALLQPAAVQLHSAIEAEQVRRLRAQSPALKVLQVVHVNGAEALKAMGTSAR